MANEWINIRLGDVCSKIGSGATPRGGSDVYLDKGKIALIRSQNIYNSGFHHDGLAFISEQHAKELDNVEVLPGDVLLNITGDSVARCCQVDEAILPARVNQHVAIIRPDRNKLDPRFLRYFLISPDMQANMLSWAGAGGTRNALTKGMIESFEVSAPADVDDQRVIAQVLGTLDDKIELNSKMNQTLETMARAIFKSWFVDFDPVRAKAASRDPGLPPKFAALFPSSFEESELGELPKGWKAARWGDIVTLEYGRSLTDYDSDNKIYPVYGTNGEIGTHSSPLCNHPGIIIGRKGAYRGVHFCSTPFFVIDTAFYVEPKVPTELRWAYHELLRQDINSMDSGSAIPSTSREEFYRLPVVTPTIEVQKAFVQLLNPFWERQEQNNKQSRNLAALRDSLLPKLLSGEIKAENAKKLVALSNRDLRKSPPFQARYASKPL